MAAKPASKAAVLVKKKVWLPIIAPALFNNQPIGEMYVEEPAQAIGRRVTVSLMTLTNDPQRQNVLISFDVAKTDNNHLQTKVFGYKITPPAVRKMMRRGRDRVDDSFVVKCNDGVAVRVKPVLITRGRAKGGALAHLRKQLRISTIRGIAKLSFLDFIKDLVAHKFQRELHDSLRKVYPLQVCELRDVHIETSEKGLKSILTAPPAPAQPPAEQPTPEAAQEPAPEAA
jgi:ribosomal protein S3AE